MGPVDYTKRIINSQRKAYFQEKKVQFKYAFFQSDKMKKSIIASGKSWINSLKNYKLTLHTENFLYFNIN